MGRGDGAWPILDQDPFAYVLLQWALPIIGLAFSILIRARGSRREGLGWGDVQWAIPVTAAVAYVGWLLSNGDPVFLWNTDPRIGGTLLLFLSTVWVAAYPGVEQ